MKIQGERIYLFPISDEDTDLIIRWRNDKSVQNNFIFREPFTREMHQKWLNEKVATGEVVQFIIAEKATQRKIGTVFLRDINKINLSAEYGIFIGESDARGCGYGTEACKLITDYGFSELGLHRIFLRVFSRNQSAISSYIKAGYVTEGIAKDMVFLDNRFNDIVFMAQINSKESKKEK